MPGVPMRPEAAVLGELALLLGLVAAACRIAARRAGVDLSRRVLIAAACAPLVIVAPYLAGRAFLAPNHILAEQIPGTPPRERTPFDDQADVVLQLLPWELEVRRAYRELRFPFWSDLLEGGSSPWSNPQTQVLSPIALLARLFPFEHFLLAALVFKVVIAGAGAWVLAAVIGLRRPARALAASAFALGGGILAWGLFPLSSTAAWLPWLGAAAVRCTRRPGAPSVVAAGLVAAMVLLAGHPEVALIGGVFAGWIGWTFRARRAGAVPAMVSLGAAAALGACLAAPVLVPFARRVPDALRLAQDVHLVKPATVLADPRTWFPAPARPYLLAPFGPEVSGRPYRSHFPGGAMAWADPLAAYAGVAAAAGMILVVLDRRSRRRYGPIGVFVLLLILAAAEFQPLAALLRRLPFFRAFTAPRGMAVAALGVALLGGAGWDQLLRRRRSFRVGGAVVATLCFGAIALAPRFSARHAVLWALAAMVLAVARRRRRAAIALLAAVVVLDLVPWARWNLPRGKRELFYPPTPFIQRLAQLDAAPGPGRVTAAQRHLYPSLLPVFGMAEIRPHNPLAPRSYLRLLKAAFGFDPTGPSPFGGMVGLEHPLLDFLNVRHVALGDLDERPPKLLPVEATRMDFHRIASNPRALPRWFFAAGVERVPPAGLERWMAALRDARVVSVREPGAPAWLAQASFASEPSEELSLLAMRPGWQRLRIRTARPRLVATSLLDAAGWRATAAGRELETVVLHGAFLGFRAPAGEYEVELRYRPPGLLPGLALAAAGVLSIPAMLARRRLALRSR